MRTINFSLLFLLAGCASLTAREHEDKLQSMLLERRAEPSRKVELLWQEPNVSAPWPVVIYLHGHQEGAANGAKAFADWGVLKKTAGKGYLAVAVSLPGYGQSDGPRDFGGSDSQEAVADVIRELRNWPMVDGKKIVLEGVSRGASVAAKLGEMVSGLAGLVLISGVYEVGEMYSVWKKNGKETRSRLLAETFEREVDMAETGPTDVEVTERSVLPEPDIRCPVLVFQGGQDPLTSVEQANELVGKISKRGFAARAVVYPEAGHYIPVELREKETEPFLRRAFRLNIL